MCWSAATAASAAAASGSTKLLRSGIFVFARRLACARRPSSRSRCDARANELCRGEQVSSSAVRPQLGAAMRTRRLGRRIWPQQVFASIQAHV